MTNPPPPVRVATVPSPCVDICRMNAATGWCEGCLRTLDEIAAWARLDDGARRTIWKLLPARRASLPPAGGFGP